MKRRTAKPRVRKTARRPIKITPESPLTPYDVNAAAIDVGAESHWVAVSPEGRAESVRECGVAAAAWRRAAVRKSLFIAKNQQESFCFAGSRATSRPYLTVTGARPVNELFGVCCRGKGYAVMVTGEASSYPCLQIVGAEHNA